MSEAVVVGVGGGWNGDTLHIKPYNELWCWLYGDFRTQQEWVSYKFTPLNFTTDLLNFTDFGGYAAITFNDDKTVSKTGYTYFTNYTYRDAIGFFVDNGSEFKRISDIYFEYKDDYNPSAGARVRYTYDGYYSCTLLEVGWRNIDGYAFGRSENTFPTEAYHTDGKYYARPKNLKGLIT